MSVANTLLRDLVTEPWLGLSRRFTTRVLADRLAKSHGVTPYRPEPRSILYQAASALPWHISGYTTRTHEVIRALGAAGGTVHALTRPGYPADRVDRLADVWGNETRVAGVNYHHLAAPLNNRPVILYALQAAPVIAAEAERRRVAVIHAASNHVNALPALLAARRLGIPFQYEMRGLWELTRISRQPAFEDSQAYRQGLALEALVAREADRLFVISGQLGRHMVERWGVDERRMALLPNCVDAGGFDAADPAAVEADTIGYAGSLIVYEGLDTLIEATARLLAQGRMLQVRIAGDGEARAGLEALAERLGVGQQVQFLGRVVPAEARAMIARCALVCIPRRPFEVCRIVPPIKLVEALAVGKPVIVPDLPVFRDELGPTPGGWFFRAGDAQDLARVIDGALARPDVLAALGRCGREYALGQRNWARFVTPIIDALPG